ncbi:hypothetical protein EVAR_100508_1 [Eumeta japonica]|uniref:Uncharacterized protein n=1 Tax=Eumeta variegata TaxID=151549 RepID=A0A4C2A7Y4_EUMVA|nr:hypothetical protein EVAR_100508_1 [Eumeta japonica]
MMIPYALGTPIRGHTITAATALVPWTTRLVVLLRVLRAFECSFEPRSVVSGSARVRVCGVPRSVSRAAAIKPRASVPATHP